MKTVRFIGSGATVRTFLMDFASDYLDIGFKLYARNPEKLGAQGQNVDVLPLDQIIVENIPTVVCCSTDESEILKESQTLHSREVVAAANLKIIAPLLQKGVFDLGTFFVLTNPSEIVAQYIATKSGNRNVYALGLSVDQLRYQAILRKSGYITCDNDFSLSGTHWFRPIPVLTSPSELTVAKLNTLANLLTEAVAREFNGYRPPIRSGSIAIHHIIRALDRGLKVNLSGAEEAKKTFLGGVYDAARSAFSQIHPSGIAASALLSQVIQHHESLMTKVYQCAS